MTVHVLAVALATVASFLAASAWYTGFARVMARLHPAYAEGAAMRPWQVLLELLRTLVVAAGMAVALDRMRIDGAGPALAVAVAAWVAFPVVLLTGSVLHERVPWRLAAIHVGDWLVKLVVIALVVTVVLDLWS